MQKLPESVRKQAERADEIYQQMMTGNTPAPAAAPAPAEGPPAEPAPEPQVTADTQPAAAPAAPPAAPVLDSWELKYRVLEGKYRAEVPRLAEDNRKLKEENASLKLRVEQPAAGAAPAGDGGSVTIEGLRSQFGDEWVAAVQSVAGQQANRVREELAPQMTETRDTVANVRRAEFVRDLGGLVPNFRAIDVDPGFTAYLDEFDAMTGRTRREFFTEADASNDAARVAAFFLSYQRSVSTAPAPTPAAPAPAPSTSHLVEPDTSSRRGEPPAGKKTWTAAEIKQFYVDARARNGRPTGIYTTEEYERINRDISLASTEGRIRG
jgi:hypothetical protein